MFAVAAGQRLWQFDGRPLGPDEQTFLFLVPGADGRNRVVAFAPQRPDAHPWRPRLRMRFDAPAAPAYLRDPP